ncbi:hypothetical protein FS837_000892 [Tulasnella sp. UAMH 9824]|nr:hypothetical protein FS837_000892 [Tulasnella sp. UAMH 9824]
MNSVTLCPIDSREVVAEVAADFAITNHVLPPELLVTVFDDLYRRITELLPFPLPYAKAVEHFTRHPLLKYMLVCRRWFNIIQTSPYYWTFAEIGVMIGGPQPEESQWHAVRHGELILEAQKRLEKSGSLPLHLTIAPEFIMDFDFMLQVLEKHVGRLETLNIVAGSKYDTIRYIPQEDFKQLLGLPFLSLKRLYIGKLDIADTLPETDDSHLLQIDLDAPHLDQLLYPFHAIFPATPSRLTLLSISKSNFSLMNPPFSWGQIELPELLELRIAKCKPGPILFALSTPLLQVLIFHSNEVHNDNSMELPEYPYLRDLQWADNGHDPTFELIFQRCPNLTRYANFAIGRENKISHGMTDGPTILEGPGGINSIEWPRLEEVLFDCVSCFHLLALVKLVPTIKRIRVIKDPYEFGDMETEKKLLDELRQKVDVGPWLDPWSHN